ncbi:hypothetical protein JMK10_10530 [Rhodovulum sulfidophilum]|uniref:DUF7742 family protein n=1 Tax=Rhodovulum sulfidophilum TaxID=35806 RepID=UPI001922772F|nr:hypothetical protein [Rhodovulum sulfidophilum]MBL3572651.1 hypothetical protein [Rhodovulum sulfidophilum]MCE8432976.1 hypothetical protein [Rhodovulum sulfidophilum]MCF4117239.1 hypothetical protein [Rhodovulum sulfidophilum]
MRPVLHGDAVAAARALYRLPATERGRMIGSMLLRVEAADCYRKRFGRGHPRWGDGSLMALAQNFDLPPEPSLDDTDYCRCLAQVLGALATWRDWKAALSSPG